jgi:hypothetical protein
MPFINIYVTQDEIDAAKRIAKRMFPETPNMVDAQNVISSAAQMGMKTLRVVWNEPEKNLEGIEK